MSRNLATQILFFLVIHSGAAFAEVNDYLLFESSGLTVRSTFATSGDGWCKHVYVAVVADYAKVENKNVLLQPNYAGFLEKNIVSKIKDICPGFPGIAKYSRQIINFQVREKGKELARERLNFKINKDDRVTLIDDLAAKSWRKWNKDHAAIMPGDEKAAELKKSQLPAGLDDPSNMYLISYNGTVSYLTSNNKVDRDRGISVKGHQIDDNKPVISAIWYPQYQQFMMRGWVKMPGNERCNQFSKRYWSSKIKPARYALPSESSSGQRTITIFEETSEYPAKRKPRMCINAKLDPMTCNMQSCNRFVTPPGNFVIVSSREDALAISKIMAARFKKGCQLTYKSEWLASICPR